MTLENFRAVNLKIDRANGSFLSDQFAKAGDYNGRRLVVQLSNAGVVGDLTGVDVNLGWQHDTLKNTGLDPFEPVDLTQGIFEIYYPKEMLTNGNVTALIQIIENDHITETKNFKIKVEKSVIDEDTIVSENSFTVLQDALLTVNRYDSRIANVENSKVDKSTFEQSTNNLTAQLQQTEQSINAQLAQTATRTELETEKSRIDNLINLPSGATTNDARLEDIKVGVDGIIYPSPGDAVRKQLDERARAFKLTNLQVGGDFTGYNASDWSNTNGAVTHVSGKARFTLSSGNGMFWRTETSIPTGHKFYTKIKYKQSVVGSAAPRVRLSTSTDVKLGANNTQDNVLETVATNTLGVASSVRFFVNVGADNYVDIDEWMMIDLTSAFGAGNEPTLEEMQILLDGLGYISGTREIAQIHDLYNDLKTVNLQLGDISEVIPNLTIRQDIIKNNDEVFNYQANGGLISGETITIPQGSRGNTSAIRWLKNINKDFTGKRLEFNLIVKISDTTSKFYTYPPSIRFGMSVIRDGELIPLEDSRITLENTSHKYLSGNQSLYKFEYLVVSGDESLRPTFSIYNYDVELPSEVSIEAQTATIEVIDMNEEFMSTSSFMINEMVGQSKIEDNSIKEEKLFFLPDYFDAEIKDTVEKIENLTTANSLVLSLLTDSHNDASLTDRPFSQTAKTIQAVNEYVNLDGIMHMGDIIDGRVWLMIIAFAAGKRA